MTFLSMQNLNLQILWLNDSLGFCINCQTPKGIIPLTSYYFWPINDAWEQLKVELDSKLWLQKEERVKVLNLVVDTMNNWQRSRNLINKKKLLIENVPITEKVYISGLS